MIASTDSRVVAVRGAEFLAVVQPLQQRLTTVQTYICVGDRVPKDMIDYTTLAAYPNAAEALVELADQHDLALMFTSGSTGTPNRCSIPTIPSIIWPSGTG